MSAEQRPGLGRLTGPVGPTRPEHLEQVLTHRSNFRDPDAHPRAAVAAIFIDGPTELELLFIERAKAEGDPWSGHMAFPGGRHESSDTDSYHTAMRETDEEIGLDLSTARTLGSLSDVDGGKATNRPITVSGHCFWLPEPPPPFTLSSEVEHVLWVPLSVLLDRDRYIDYFYPRSGAVFPGIQLDKVEHVIWGLTLRFLSDLFARLGHPFVI